MPLDDARPRRRTSPTKEEMASDEIVDRAAVERLRQEDDRNHWDVIALWRAVILNALHDAFVLKPALYHHNAVDVTFSERLEILEWLFTPSRDFLTVCEMAEIDPAKVRQTASELELLPREAAKKRVGRLLSCSESR